MAQQYGNPNPVPCAEELVKKGSNWNDYNDPQYNLYNNSELAAKNTLTVLYFNWKTWEHNVYKIKETSSGAKKAIKKHPSIDDT